MKLWLERELQLSARMTSQLLAADNGLITLTMWLWGASYTVPPLPPPAPRSCLLYWNSRPGGRTLMKISTLSSKKKPTILSPNCSFALFFLMWWKDMQRGYSGFRFLGSSLPPTFGAVVGHRQEHLGVISTSIWVHFSFSVALLELLLT